MRVALVGPELEENLALRYIHAAVAAAGHEAEIFDFHEEGQTSGLVDRIVAYGPEAVGLSMVFTARAREYVRLAAALRGAWYAGHITAGGHFASLHAERLLRDVPAISSVLHGEGERAMTELLGKLDSPSAVAGISIREEDGEILHTGPRPPVDDLDELPFPTRPVTFHRYFGRPIANILSGRGCFANCDFCSINAWHRIIGGKRFRQRSVENLVSEMAHLYYARGVRVFNFHDDNFFLPSHRRNAERFAAIQQALAAHGVGRIAIQVKARPDSIEPESIAILKEIGLFRVFLGVESNAVAGLKALGRGISREQNRRAVELLKEMGLHVTFNLLMFEPECTLADLRENIRFMAEQADVPLNFCRTEVYAGTALEERLRAAGRLEGDYFGYGYTLTDARSQLAYELFREAFSPRNFDYGGMNLLAMTLDYHLHLLRHFHAGAGGVALRDAVKVFIRELNANNVELLERICAFAESRAAGGRAGVEAFAQTVSAERAAFDERMRPCCAQLLQQMRQLAARRQPRKPRHMPRYAAAVMVAGALLTDCVHSTEMAPAGQSAQAADPRHPAPHERVPAPLGRPHPAPTEMAPRPVTRPKTAVKPKTRPKGGAATRPAGTRPAGRPTSRPTTQASRPAMPKLPKADVEKVEQGLRSSTIRKALARIGRKYKMEGETVEVELVIAAGGKVAGVTVHLPEGKPKGLQDELVKLARTWRFSGVRKAGECSLDIELGEAPIKSYPTEMAPRDMHMFEMAPEPAEPPAGK